MQALGLKFEASSSIQDNLDDITGVVSDDIIGVILEKKRHDGKAGTSHDARLL